jgi:hypothetical protein
MLKFLPIDLTKLPLKNLIIVCLAGVCFASIHQCSNKSIELENNEGNWKFRYAMMVDSFETTVNSQGEAIALQEQLLINEKQAKDLLAMENSSLKEISSSTKTTTVTKVEKVFVPFSEVVSSGGLSDTNKVMSRSFGLSTEWYSLRGRVLSNGVSIDSMSISNEITTNIGWKKDKWYKPKYAVVEVKNTNPHTVVTGMKNVVVKPPKPKRISIGPSMGVTYSNGSIQPTISFSVQYNLLRF